MRKLIALLLLAALMLSLAACGAKKEDETTDAAAEEATREVTEAAAEEVTEAQTEPETEPAVSPEEEKYQRALELYNGGGLEEAYRLLYELKDYRDAKDLLATIAVMPRTVTGTGKDGTTTVTGRTYEVDEDGYLTKGSTMVYPKYTVYEYRYDDEHRIAGSLWGGSEENFSGIEYDENGRIVKFGNCTYEYDAAGNLIKKTYALGNEDGSLSYETCDYEYDDAGNTVKESKNGEVTCEWKYDGEGRLIEYTSYGTTEKYEYDNEGRRVYYNRDGDAETTYEYTMGETENLFREIRDGKVSQEVTVDKEGAVRKIVNYAGDAVTGEQEYFYDEDGRIVKVTHKSYSVNGYDYYDDDGNEMIDPEGTQEYEYNEIGLVVKYSSVGVPYGTGVYEYSDFAYFRLDPFDNVNELLPDSYSGFRVCDRMKKPTLDDPFAYFWYSFDFDYRA